ncbi:unnamed protein product [Moneuplotes crassus]|uniref:Tc1-like transposase DDE domain-containing protein n=1 Tax=Euplotes crassus TaxID=5936 RepID=A0AAD1UDU0_EUPCR|nr:unnamed protein product [Moneuplotes crassus]
MDRKDKLEMKLICTFKIKMRFVISYCILRVGRLLGKIINFDQVKYKHFLSELYHKPNGGEILGSEKTAQVDDICRFHRTKIIKKFLLIQKMRCVFIPSYSPEANPCVKLINLIKSKIKTLVN